MRPDAINITPGRDTDSQDVIALISSIYAEYGEVMFLQGADADLAAIERTYRHAGGEFWVCRDADGQLVGTVAVKFHSDSGEAVLKRLYVRKASRGTGLADELFDLVLAWSAARGAQRLVSWSDTRFTRAHAFYARRGMSRIGTRDMTDGALPYSEYGYAMTL